MREEDEVNDDVCSYPLKDERYEPVSVVWRNKWEWANDVIRLFRLFLHFFVENEGGESVDDKVEQSENLCKEIEIKNEFAP